MKPTDDQVKLASQIYNSVATYNHIIAEVSELLAGHDAKVYSRGVGEGLATAKRQNAEVEERVRREAQLTEAEWWMEYHKLNQPLGPYDVGEKRLERLRKICGLASQPAPERKS